MHEQFAIGIKRVGAPINRGSQILSNAKKTEALKCEKNRGSQILSNAQTKLIALIPKNAPRQGPGKGENLCLCSSVVRDRLLKRSTPRHISFPRTGGKFLPVDF
jgi:hypothetical protein